MQLYRISSAKFADDLSGTGAKLYGGRWNAKGVPVVYLASSRSLAMLELLVHLRPENLIVPYVISTIELPEDKILTVQADLLPNDWNKDGSLLALHQLTNDFIEKSKFLMMRVPSAIVEEEYNFVLNPAHADFAKVSLLAKRSFTFDQRFKK